ncbi:MAG: AIM24 family protein, partial [Hyphomicrobiales bacterium]|nr:AIM24 family protein [Hyphomicrobiales bacterium]
MRYEISGSVMQTVAIDLDPGETVYSQTNTMAWMNDAMTMDTHTGGGFFAGLKRTFGGGSFFVTDFTSNGAGHVAFAPRFPGRIFAAMLQDGQSLICRKETFLVAQKSITLELA